ncbi:MULTISPECIES: hypothetical protein [Kordiimonas]|uniref:hypothetical protein n=1 Tax=Kordiimonas TaxID=288021 RepID=UPI001FF59E74|nr:MULTISPECIES: hypothetical protein [Kordiimonas]MCK0068615.1 hypothetical protein [Kordiimonas laminariae]UTW57975.1 hypothetical protein KFE96_14245 [Kordiimonas sp. SCSIO 12603]
MHKNKLFISISTACILLGACSKKDIDPITQIPPARAEQIYNRVVREWDENKDGKASCEDVAVRRRALFKVVDADKSGDLWPGEYRLAKFEDRSFHFFEFPKADVDESGRIELDEFIAIPPSRFQGFDADSDCLISKEEALRAEIAAIRSGERRRSAKSEKNKKNDEKVEELLPIPD